MQIEKHWDDKNKVWIGQKALAGQNIEQLNPFWIFGYGSLCFKYQEIPYQEMIDCCVLKGYIRRFYQLSSDHRGTVINPGLVATVISEEELIMLNENYNNEDLQVWGRAFMVSQENVQTLLDKLDFREKGGYTQKIVEIESEGLKIKALLYTGTIDNPNFAGNNIRQDIDKQAQIIAFSEGPSGLNKDYLLNFCEYLKKYDKLDQYMKNLLNKVQDALIQGQL